MGMYVDRPPVGDGGSRELEQGDVLHDVLLPKLPREHSFGFQRQGTGKGDVRWFWKKNLTGEELLAQEGKELRVMTQLQREPYVIVLSNSCDNASGDEPLLVAPVRPFVHYESPAAGLRKTISAMVSAFAAKCSAESCQSVALLVGQGGALYCEACAPSGQGEFLDVPHADMLRDALKSGLSDDELERERDAERWMAISRSATAANPKRFYMPGDPARAFQRSEADLVITQSAEPGYISRCLKELKASRVFGLSEEAVRHLQYTINSFFGRNPRDDHAWPSDDDLALKATWLKREIATVRDDALRTERETELAVIQDRLARR